ncbi:hypothetical protein ABES03_16665 [Neobacillus rhizosphaerae]|uniref:hypothetical protein n=1 Tax=Neobacillus rhizosphaerae TaxID=2880965 RepID=UPI003D2E14C7
MFLHFLLHLVEGLFISSGSGSVLNTQKIDKNIDLLKEQAWFKQLYEDERYHRLFFVNRRVRKYLQSTIRVKRIISNPNVQQKFLLFLDKQVEHSRKS